MAEKTPLLEKTAINSDQFGPGANDLVRRFKSTETVNVRPKSAPPIQSNVYWDDNSEESPFINHRTPRPKTSVGDSEEGDEEWIGRTLNRQRSGGNEDEVFLNRETNKNSDGKSKIMNMALLYIILVIWSIASHMQSPVYSQYLYRRIMEQVFGNSSLSNGGNHTDLNTTECFKPSLNESSDHDEAYSLQEKAQQLSTEINMKFTLCSYGFCFISTVLFGAYSDYFGRKMLFLIPMFGHLVVYAFITIVIYWEMDIKYFFVTSTISGICTTEIFTIACYAYVADNTPPKGSRTIGLAIIGITETLTSAALSTGVGYFIQLKGYFLPSLTAAAIVVLAIVAVIFILPEKKKIAADPIARQRERKEKADLSPVKAFRNVFGFYFFDGTCKRRSMFSLYLIAYFAHEVAGKTGNIGTLWEMNYPLCWSPEMMGYYGTGSTIFSELIKLPLLRFLQCWMNDQVIVIWSNLAYTGSIILKSFSDENLMMYGVAFMAAFDVSVSTVVKSISSRMAGQERQGALFASFAIVNIFTGILGTPAFSELYKYTVDIFRGTSYLVSAGVQCICTVCLIVFAILERKGYAGGTDVIRMKENRSQETSSQNQSAVDTNV